MEERVTELEVEVVFEIYPNLEQGFYIYSLKPVEDTPEVILDHQGTFVAKGHVPRLHKGERHKIKIKEAYDKTYGKQYEFVSIQLKLPETVEEQQAYVKGLVTEIQYSNIMKAYPNEKILDLILGGEFDHTKVEGFGGHTLNTVKKRLEEYLELHEAMNKLEGLEITLKSMQKLVEHFGSPSAVVSAVEHNIYNLCRVKGFGFKKVDSYAMNRGDDPNSKFRILACVNYILGEEEDNGHIWASYTDIANQSVELLAIERTRIEECISNIGDIDPTLVAEQQRVYLRKNHFYETSVFDMLLQLDSNKPENFDVNLLKDRVKEVEKDIGFEYNQEQKEAIYQALTNNVFILNGKGGVGKSATVRGIVGAMGRPAYTSVALSGSAAKILRNEGLHAGTIHKTLGVSPTGGFIHNSKNKLPYSVIIVDEASMVNSYLFFSLLSAMREGAKLILVGDNGQLPAIGAGAVFDDLIKSDRFAQKELTQVHRQAAKSGTLLTANKIRDGKQVNGYINYNTQRIGENQDFTLIPLPNADHIFDTVLNICRSYNGDIEDFQVITGRASNAKLSVAELNPHLQKIFNPNARSHTSVHLTVGKNTYYEGDKVIQNGNNYEAGENKNMSVLNGTTGKIVAIQEKHGDNKPSMTINFDGAGDLITYDIDELRQISMAYAITTHKSQGSSIPTVVFAFDFTSYTFLNREFVYTGITRASKGCVTVVDNRALYTAIKTVGNSRRTLLLDKLREQQKSDNNIAQAN